MRITFSLVCFSLMMISFVAWSQPNMNSADEVKDQPNNPTQGVGKPGYGTNTPENPVFDPNARRAQRLADDLKSPFCPGKTLKTCTSPNAAKVRRDIQEMVLQGVSDDAIVQSLKASYDTNEFSVANPEQPAYTIFVPFVPFVILTGGMILMIWLMRRRKKIGGFKEPDLPIDDKEQAATRSALRERLMAEDREF